MALTDFAAFRSMVKNSVMLYPRKTATATNPLGSGSPTHTFLSWWTLVGGAAPTTAVVPTDATAGAWPKKAATGDLYLTGATEFTDANGYESMFMLVDRVSHQGGIDSSVTPGTPLTTNLPTAALTRYTSGVGVYAALTGDLSSNSPTASQITISYTNSAGAAGQTGLFQFPNFQVYSKIADPFCLAAGDDGIKSVESITFPTSYGAGFGVCLFKPLAFFMSRINGGLIPTENIVGWNSAIHTNAALDVWQVRVPGVTHFGTVNVMQLSFGEV